nr:unnamed protein product [Spirometra erinaceieuropaei]
MVFSPFHSLRFAPFAECSRIAVGPEEFLEELHFFQFGGWRAAMSLHPLGTAVGDEKRSSSFGCGTVDSLDGGENVLSFLAVGVSLALLGTANCLGSLHLSQSLLNKVSTTVEGCFFAVGEATDVGFLQTVLLDEQAADDGVVVIEAVVMFATCANEDSKSRPSVDTTGYPRRRSPQWRQRQLRLEGWLSVQLARC